MSSAAASRQPVYYGWWVLCAGAITEMLAIGSTSYAAGLFVLPLERELGLSRAEASSAIPIVFSGGVVVAALVGYLLDHVPIQRVIGIGGLLLGAGFILISMISSPPLIALILFVPVALGFVAIGPLTTTTLVSRWFYRRRGRALGIATVATSGGGIIVVPALSWAIENYGWRLALQIEGLVIAAVVFALSAFIIRSGPAELGLAAHSENKGRPTGEVEPEPASRAPSRQWRFREFLSTFNFWAIALALAGMMGISQAIVVTIVPYAIGLGASAALAALLISTFSVTAAVVKVGSGLLLEIIDRRLVMFASTLAMLCAMLALLWSSDYSMLLVACCLAGIAQGCMLPSAPAIVAEYFGSVSFGTIMGCMYAATGISSIVAVSFAGAVFDRTGSYDEAFFAFGALSIFAAIAIAVMRTAIPKLRDVK